MVALSGGESKARGLMGPLQSKELRGAGGSAERSAIKEGWAATQQWAEQVDFALSAYASVILLLCCLSSVAASATLGGAVSGCVRSVCGMLQHRQLWSQGNTAKCSAKLGAAAGQVSMLDCGRLCSSWLACTTLLSSTQTQCLLTQVGASQILQGVLGNRLKGGLPEPAGDQGPPPTVDSHLWQAESQI